MRKIRAVIVILSIVLLGQFPVQATPSPKVGTLLLHFPQALSNFYSVFLAQTEDNYKPTSENSAEDGSILSINGDRAYIDLGLNDEIEQGMLLELYRENRLHDPISDRSHSVLETLGFGLVVQLFDETAVLHLSNFEVKTSSAESSEKTAVEVFDRVRRPIREVEEAPMTLPEPVVVEGERPAEYAKVVSINGNSIHLKFDGTTEVGDLLTLVKEPKEIVHPISGELIIVGEEKRSTCIVRKFQGEFVELELPAQAMSSFVSGDEVKIIRHSR